MDERQKELLKEIVEGYIKEAKPIGSKHLCDKFNCSSATIRNEMSVLEKLGYIEKTIFQVVEFQANWVISIM